MNPDLLATAVACYQAEHYEDCATICRSLLAQEKHDPAATTLLAMALQAMGRLDEAAERLGALAAAHPRVPEYWSNYGLLLRHLHRFDEADQIFLHALSLAPGTAEILVNYGLLLLDMGRIADARHRFLDACEADNTSAEARIHAASACLECGDILRAEALVPPSPVWPSLDASLRQELIKVLATIGRTSDAESLLLSDLEDTDDPVAALQLAMLHERTNRIDSAVALLEKVRRQMTAESDVHLQADALALESALAMRRKDFEHARSAADAFLQLDALPVQSRAEAHFTLARIADKQGRVEDTIAQLAKAHKIQLDFATDIVPEIAAAVEPLRIASKWMRPEECDFLGDAEAAALPSPVFIVGFPRSGTTMLEQMLDAHPGFASMDERIIIQQCVEAMEAMGLVYPHQLDQLDEASLGDLRALYWAEASKVVPLKAGQVLVDKNPLNMLRLPMIKRLFPTARIILALRHPCDVIFSCYMQTFRAPSFMVLCSSLERLSKTYVNAMRFWIHHQPLLCPDVLILRYEDTVTDFLPQVDRIADYLGIVDRAPLATFSEHAARKGYISTPSYSQVIEPVNTKAVARWLPYRKYFEPVFPILKTTAEHWNYRLEE